MKPRAGFSTARLPAYPHNYDPRGRNPFEEDALVLRAFWDSLADYAGLRFLGEVAGGPGSHRYVLASGAEAVAYLSSATGEQDVLLLPAVLRLTGLPLPDGDGYALDVWDPKGGAGVIERRTVAVAGGELTVELPAFVDDLALHIRAPGP